MQESVSPEASAGSVLRHRTWPHLEGVFNGSPFSAATVVKLPVGAGPGMGKPPLRVGVGGSPQAPSVPGHGVGFAQGMT